MTDDGRFVVGLLTSGLNDPFSRDMEFGVLQRAEEENVNVVLFPGKFIRRKLDLDIRYEYQYSTMFNMITEDNIDAVIISADSICNYCSKEQVTAFINKYSEIPSVLIASKEDGKSSISYDNYKGIEEGINYLIEQKGCTKFAMLGGPDANSDARERKESLIRILKDNNIDFDIEKNFVSGNLSRRDTPKAAQLLDQNPDVEAVFCVNDDTALALYDVMKERGLVPGEDIFVLGYDNLREAGQVRPTLSSIWADPVELARQAFDMAMNLLRGRKTPSRTLDTMFVKRDSFGTDATHTELVKMNTDQIKFIYNKVFYRLQGARGKEYKAYQKVIKDCIALIQANEYCPELHEQFLSDCRAAINSGLIRYADMELLQNVVEDIYDQIAEGEVVRKDRKEVRDSYGAVYRMLVGCQEERIREITQMDKDLDFSLKMVAQDIMLFENGNDVNYSVPLRKLPFMGIHNAYLYILEKPIVHLEEEDWVTPEYMYLKAILKNDEVKYVNITKQKVSIDDIYRNDLIGDERFGMVFLPLYSNETVYGYILADMSEQLYENGEILVNQMSAAMKMLQVLRNSEEIKTQLEDSLVTLRENNIILDNMSKEDSMTKIHNRRGFVEAAQACMEAAYDTGIPVMIMYVDMDNLKIVNDRYGHDAGDFALKHIAEVLSEKVGQEGTVGRIGGDEFACLIWNDTDPDEFKKSLKKSFDDFNKVSDLEYNISACVGICPVPEGEKISLEEALSRADEDLYQEKKLRTKNPTKVITRA